MPSAWRPSSDAAGSTHSSPWPDRSGADVVDVVDDVGGRAAARGSVAVARAQQHDRPTQHDRAQHGASQQRGAPPRR